MDSGASDGAPSADSGGGTDSGCGPALFAAPELLPGINSGYEDQYPGISFDGLTLFFGSTRPGGLGSYDLWMATRGATTEVFGAPVNLTQLNTSSWEGGPAISSDGLTLYFAPRGVATDPSTYDIMVSTRPDTGSGFSAPVPLTEVNSAVADFHPWISANDLTLYFTSGRSGGTGDYDVWVATRATPADAFDAPVAVTAVNSTSSDFDPTLTADERTIYFASRRMSIEGDLFIATRSSASDAFGPPTYLSDLNTPDSEWMPSVSPDGDILYFASNRPGTIGFWSIFLVRRCGF
jgi:Tol biopolymer transport system component